MQGDEPALQVKYGVGVPNHCPPNEAEEKAATLYRICAKNPADDEDYTPHINSKHGGKRQRAQAELDRNPMDCTPSGLSVWITEDAIKHACKVLPFTQGRYVFATEVQATDGKLQPTRSEEHHTYWPRASTNLKDKATLAFGPIDRAVINVD